MLRVPTPCFGALVIASAGLVASCSPTTANNADQIAMVEAVLPRSLPGAQDSRGAERYPVRVIYDREAMISLRVGGTLTALPVHPGDRVAAGAVLAEIDPTLQVSSEQRAAADVAQLERAVRRNATLLPAGAISEAQQQDLQSALAAAQAALRAARYDRASTVARAPFRGLILARMHEAGETVAPGEPVLRMADVNSPLIARAAVTPARAAGIAPGRPVLLTLAGMGEISGKVLRKGSAVDPVTGTLDVDIGLPASPGVASGLTGSVSLTSSSAQASGRLYIPAEALLDANGRNGHVLVVDPARGIARLHAITLHGFIGDMLEVEGLPASARVITAGAGFVRDGQKVRVDAR